MVERGGRTVYVATLEEARAIAAVEDADGEDATVYQRIEETAETEDGPFRVIGWRSI